MVNNLPVMQVIQVPGCGRSPGEGNGYPLQYPCLENSIDRGAWRPAVHGVTKSRKQLNDSLFIIHVYLCVNEMF